MERHISGRKCALGRHWSASGQVLRCTAMCGIAGLYTKNDALRSQLGCPPRARCSGSCRSRSRQRRRRLLPGSRPRWVVQGLGALARRRACLGQPGRRARRAVRRRLAERGAGHPRRVHGRRRRRRRPGVAARHAPRADPDERRATIEIFKEAGLPTEFVRRFDLASIDGSHALGHTRMATESRVTTEHSHPFSTGLDLCLVHNGSLSNHNRLRRSLRREGIRFQTDNDSEVAAGYLTWRLRAGSDAGAGARGVPGRPRRLLHVRGRDRRRLRRAA